MDEKPFLTIDLLDLNETLALEVKKLSKESFLKKLNKKIYQIFR